MTCNPHRWDCENWLPLFQGTDPDAYPAMTCLSCDRKLAIMDTTPNMRASIAHAIASRLFDGDEHSEVYDAMQDYFSRHLGRRQLP